MLTFRRWRLQLMLGVLRPSDAGEEPTGRVLMDSPAFWNTVILAAWILPVVLGLRLARRKGVSPHWMWFGLYPLAGWIPYLMIAARPPCPSCGSFRYRRARPDEAKSSGDAFRRPRKCVDCSHTWEPELPSFLLLLGVPAGLGVIAGAVLWTRDVDVLLEGWKPLFAAFFGFALVMNSIYRLTRLHRLRRRLRARAKASNGRTDRR